MSKFNSHADYNSSYPLKCQQALYQYVVDTLCLSDVAAATSSLLQENTVHYSPDISTVGLISGAVFDHST